MNFFQAQDTARRNTLWLLLLFLFAIIGTVAVIYLLATIGLQFMGSDITVSGDNVVALNADTNINLGLLTDITIGVLAVVSLGSIFKMLLLSGGGGRVAESMGGNLLLHDTRNPQERQLLNIVEEMSIAAGAPMPDIYILPDGDINAFAAGTTPTNAVIGVTRGAMQHLSREQMQGVIAHEFSHIMNGDMRLNIRLVAIIHGIMLLGYFGYFILRGSFYHHMLRGSRNNAVALVIPLLGITLIVAGFVGTFFGSWIRAAVSRQREYLADAAAVQYTRNPQGIAGALERIGQLGGMIDIKHQPSKESHTYHMRNKIRTEMQLKNGDKPDPHNIEYAHMFFANVITSNFSNPFATHPPLTERIARVMPGWSEQTPINTTATAAASAVPPVATPAAASAVTSAFTSDTPIAAFAPAAIIDKIGTLNTTALERASKIIKTIHPTLRHATEEPYAARALIYAILIDKKDDTIRQQQLEHIARHADTGVYDITRTLLLDINTLSRVAILPLVQLTLPALRLLSQKQYKRFINNIGALIEADSALDLFEWCIQAIIVNDLHAHLSGERVIHIRGNTNNAMAYTLSILARTGQQRPEQAFTHATGQAGLSLRYTNDGFDPQHLFDSASTLAHLSPQKKQQFAAAAIDCAAFNKRIDVNEAALLRAYFMIIDCPLPLDVTQ